MDVLPDAGTVLLSPISGSVLPDDGPPDESNLEGPPDDGNLEFWKRMAKVPVSESDTKEFAELLRQEKDSKSQTQEVVADQRCVF